jgi:glutaredoxin
MSRVVFYTAEGCSLCERALQVVRSLEEELGFEFALVDVGGDADLEARYREYLPVLEIDGEPAFTYFVEPNALRERLSS